MEVLHRKHIINLETVSIDNKTVQQNVKMKDFKRILNFVKLNNAHIYVSHELKYYLSSFLNCSHRTGKLQKQLNARIF